MLAIEVTEAEIKSKYFYKNLRLQKHRHLKANISACLATTQQGLVVEGLLELEAKP